MPYGKHFESMYEGSMVGAGAVVFAVWGYVIAKTKPRTETVGLHPTHLAMILGEQEAEIEKAVSFLCEPDPKSRSKEHEGRRLIPVGGYEYQVVNFKKYRELVLEENRREYMREYMTRRRATQDSGDQSYIPDGRCPWPPNEWAAAIKSLSCLQKDADECYAHYDAQGWRLGNGNPISGDPRSLLTRWLGSPMRSGNGKRKRLEPNI